MGRGGGGLLKFVDDELWRKIAKQMELSQQFCSKLLLSKFTDGSEKWANI